MNFNKIHISLSFLSLLMALIGTTAFSKTAESSISGRAVNAVSGEAIISAKVVLYNSSDSILIKGTYTLKDGSFKFENVQEGRYFIIVSYIGYEDFLVRDFRLEGNKEHKTGIVKLNQSSVTTDEITVSAQRSAVEYSLDKKIINVENSINSTGGSAVDVLQNVPSVSVDYDGNVSLRGSTNLTILIDGKPSQSMGSSRNAVLEQIPASSIESIEIINNPSAKYSPEGMNGVLNIVLKKQRAGTGINGIAQTTIGTNDKYNASLNSSYGLGAVTLNASYDIRSDRRTGGGESNRTIMIYDTASYINQIFKMNRKGFDNSVRGGIDINLNKKNWLSLGANYSFDSDGHSSNVSNSGFNEKMIITDYFDSKSNEDASDNNLNVNMNYKLKFDRKDEQLTADFSYGKSNSSESEDISYEYSMINTQNIQNEFIRQKTTSDDANINSNIELNYTKPFGKESRIETGYQGKIRNLDNDYHLHAFNDTSKIWSENLFQSNRFIYSENIHAVYATLASGTGPVKFQLGARLEQAYTKAEQKTQSDVYNNNYFSFYPSAHLTYKLTKTQDAQLSYSRRINRPGVWSLNPFRDISNPLSINYGNPYLKPEYINSLEFGHNKNWEKSTLLSNVFYRHITDVIKRVTFLDSNGIANSTSKNMTDGISYGIEFIYDHNMFQWWKANVNFSYFRTIIKGNPAGDDITTDNYSWTGKLNSTFTVWKNLNIQLNASYRAPIVTAQGMMKEMYGVDIAFKKDFFDEKLGIGFRVSDIFNTQRHDYITRGSGFEIISSRKRESRVAYLSFTYKINSGLKQKDKKKNGNGGNDDEGMME